MPTLPLIQRIDNAIFGIDPNTPLELFEARNAVKIARAANADKYAASVLAKAEQSLQQAEAAYRQKHNNKAGIESFARDAAQNAEDARVMALKKQEADRLAVRPPIVKPRRRPRLRRKRYAPSRQKKIALELRLRARKRNVYERKRRSPPRKLPKPRQKPSRHVPLPLRSNRHSPQKPTRRASPRRKPIVSASRLNRRRLISEPDYCSSSMPFSKPTTAPADSSPTWATCSSRPANMS